MGWGMNSAPASTWFIVHPDGEEGPLDPSAIRARVADGRIGPPTLLRRGDVAHPVPASQIRGLLPEASHTPGSGRTAVTTTTLRTRRTAPLREVLPAGAPPEPPPPGRVVGGRRALAIGVDGLLVGGLLLGLLAVSVDLLRGSGAEALAEVEATRAQQSAAAVSSRGDPRPRYADWPTLEPELVKTLTAQRTALAGKPSEEDARRLRQEMEYLDKRLSFERTAYERDRAHIARAATATQPLGGVLLAMTLVLAAVALPLMELLAGGTPGKLLLGQRTVGPGRRRMTIGEAFLRHAGRWVPGIHLSLLWSHDGRAAHEAWSRTEVVTPDQVRQRTVLRAVTPPPQPVSTRVRRRVA